MAQRALVPFMNSKPRDGEITGALPTFDELFQAHWERVNGVISRLVGDAVLYAGWILALAVRQFNRRDL
jgi:hypothetical protein